MIRIFKELKWFFKQEWYKYLLVLVFTLIYTYAVTIPPKYIGRFVDTIVEKSITVEVAVEICAVMFGIGFVIYLSSVLKERFLGGLFHRLFYKIKIRFMESIFRQDGDFFEEYYSGDLITRATGDTNLIAEVSTHTVFHFVDTVMMLVVAFLAMITLNVPITFLSIIPLPIILFIVLYLRPKIMRNWKFVRGHVSQLNNMVMESVTHAKLVRGFVREKDDEKKLSDQADLVYKTERKTVLMQAVFMPSFRMVTTVAQGIALAYGTYLIINQIGHFTVGNLVAFNMYLGMFARPLFRLGNQITRLSQSAISFDRVNEIINAVPSIPDKPFAKKLETVNKIEYRDVSFKFPKDSEYTIRNIDLTIDKGQSIGIVGKTGSGKTTLIRQLLRQFEITDGAVFINGNRIDHYTKDSIRECIAYVPQEHALFSRTVYENLLLGESKTTNLEVEDAVRLADFEKDLPFLTDGLQTIVGEAGVTLSGGQKQRLSIARAFLKNADVLVMDDSLSAVDGMTESTILKNLKTYREGKTNIISSHRLSVVEGADLIIVMDKGKIVERGTHQQLMESRNWYYQQYLVQQMEEAGDKHE